MSGPVLAPSTNEATRVLAGGELRYSTVWEDHLLLERGLSIGLRDDVLMICSAGCNVLNALLHGPRRIVALDVNPAQTALLELKLAAIRGLEHAQLLS
jgi:S-adenosylmethionine-diacylglycerol 3-amino-3-carboxypropyl transferase